MSVVTTNVPIEPQAAQAPLRRPWGFWSSTGWAVLAFLLATIVLLAAYAFAGKLDVLMEQNDEKVDGVSNIALWAAITGSLVLVVWMRGWRAADYFALKPPTARDFGLALAVYVPLYAVMMAAYFAFGLGVSDLDSVVRMYRTAKAEGSVLLLIAYVALMAPLTEEIIFRGFVYRGWAASRLQPIGAILLIAMIFGLIHIQYSVYGMIMCAVFGLACGWLRWRTGSLASPLILHTVNNAASIALVAYMTR